MNTPIIIVGQGLAGTMLAWELERNGAEFQIIDPGHERATSRMAAGMINPVTGQRLVKTWRVDELRPLAHAAYQHMAGVLRVPLWREMRIRRRFRDDTERRVFAERQARGELAPFAGPADTEGFWIEGAAQVDLATLLAATRRRWMSSGRLVEKAGDLGALQGKHGLIVLCTGAALRLETSLARIPWSMAKGELLTLQATGLTPNVILNQRHWLLPLGGDRAKIGATFAAGADDLSPTAAARAELERSALTFLNHPPSVRSHEVGLRLALPDKRPVAGRCPGMPEVGVLGGLGSKGVLLAPWLARQWWNHLSEGVPFDPAVDVARFWSG